MLLRKITESFDLPGPDGKVYVGEEIDGLGISNVTSDLYHVVIDDVPCAWGGKVNLNHRLYMPADMQAQHEALCAAAAKEFIDGLKGHPEGAPKWEIPVRFLGGRVVEHSGGLVETLGRFGILKTSHGDDVHTLWRAGFPIGVSLRGMAYMHEDTLEEESEFAKANPDFVGKTVVFCTGLRLGTYDVVRRASFDTYFPAAEGDLKAALCSIQEAGLLPGVETQEEIPHEPGETAEEEAMDPKEALAAFLKDHPEAAALFRAQVAEDEQKKNPLADLDDSQVSLVARVVEAIKPGDETKPEVVPEQIRNLAQEAEAAKAENATLRATVEEQGNALKAIQDELAATKLRNAITESIDAKAQETKHGAKIKALVLKHLDAGLVDSVEGAEGLFGDMLDLVKGVTVETVEAAPEPAAETPAEPQTTEEAAGEPKATPAPDPAEAPGLLGKKPTRTRKNDIAEAIRRRRAG